MTDASVLGLCSFTHDSAAALIAGGTLVGFAEEERLTGDKHTPAYPREAVSWLLNKAAITAQDVEVVAYNFDGSRYLDALAATPAFAADRLTADRAQARADSFQKVHDRYAQRMTQLEREFPNARIAPVLHHRAHGLYAFASSSYDAAAVLVVDSLGEVQTTTLGHAHRTAGGGCEHVIDEALTDPASLGYAYGAVTEHLGWRRGDEEGTVMALAALGDPARFRALFRDAIPLTATGFALNPRWFPLRVLSRSYPRVSPTFIAETCPRRDGGDSIEQVHADLAAALQERTEQIMVVLARRTQQITGMRLLCVGGGVAANCVAIAKITDAGIFDEVHVPPAPGDSGTAIGAAIGATLDGGNPAPDGVAGRCYLGPAYPSLQLAERPRPRLVTVKPAEPAKQLAWNLAHGTIAGLFQGPLEAGPRALGNRSILASPLLPDVVDRLNLTIKYREPFRPFAPVVLQSAAADYFTLRQPAPFMSIASGVTDKARAEIPAIIHDNGLARVQTVTADTNPFLAEVLTEFAAITGVPVLINTSLNIKGKPICGTPDMALDCLTSSGLDALLIEGWWVTKC